MNTSGDAADQVMRMMLEGTEVLIRLSGSGAKHTALLLNSMLKQNSKTRGAQRLSNMLRSGKPIKVYTFQHKDMEKFKEVAKEYGILYCILKEKDKTGGVFDVFIRAEDESKISRIIERFNLCCVDPTQLKTEIMREQQKKEQAGRNDVSSKQTNPASSKEDGVVEDLMSGSDKKGEENTTNPNLARAEEKRKTYVKRMIDNPSEQLSGHTTKRYKRSSEQNKPQSKRSVREQIADIKMQREIRNNIDEKSKNRSITKKFKTKER